MKMCGRVEVWLHAFLTSALDGNEWSASDTGHFTLWGKIPRYPFDRLDGPQSWSGCSGEQKSLPPLELCTYLLNNFYSYYGKRSSLTTSLMLHAIKYSEENGTKKIGGRKNDMKEKLLRGLGNHKPEFEKNKCRQSFACSKCRTFMEIE
jgi:hypothetical protein